MRTPKSIWPAIRPTHHRDYMRIDTILDWFNICSSTSIWPEYESIPRDSPYLKTRIGVALTWLCMQWSETQRFKASRIQLGDSRRNATILSQAARHTAFSRITSTTAHMNTPKGVMPSIAELSLREQSNLTEVKEVVLLYLISKSFVYQFVILR